MYITDINIIHVVLDKISYVVPVPGMKITTSEVRRYEVYIERRFDHVQCITELKMYTCMNG